MPDREASPAPAPGRHRGHHVVCGLNGLGLRLVEHLHELGADVVVVAGETTRAYRAAVETLGIAIVDGRHDDELALMQAGVAEATALALVADDDIGNLRGALLASKHGRGLRIVLRLFNEDLGERIQTLFDDCVILSQSAIAAPFFAAAALGEPDGERLALAGRSLLVRRTAKATAADDRVLLPLVNGGEGGPHVFPDQAEPGGEVLVDLGEFEDAPAGRLQMPPHRRRRLRDRWWSATATLRQIIDPRLRVMLMIMAGVLGAGTAYFSLAKGLSVLNALYFSVVTLSTVGYGDINLQNDPAHVKVVGIVFIMLGATVIALFFALLTDTIVGVRLAQILGSVRGRLRDHIVVCGLGNVGFRIVQHLAEHGVSVVAIERDEDCRQVAATRRMGIPVVIADATMVEGLHAAQVQTAQALVAATDSDVSDLEAAVNARALHPSLRIVLRLFDHDLSTAVEQRFNIHISRSTAVIAAPVFATKMLSTDLVATVNVAGATLAFAELDVAPASRAVGRSVGELQAEDGIRVLAVSPGLGARADWGIDGARRFSAGERLAVVGRPSAVHQLTAAG